MKRIKTIALFSAGLVCGLLIHHLPSTSVSAYGGGVAASRVRVQSRVLGSAEGACTRNRQSHSVAPSATAPTAREDARPSTMRGVVTR